MSISQQASTVSSSRILSALAAGCAVGVLGGLIGLGGAEFRLPLLIGLFGFAALHAVILNKAMSLVVVASALAFRSYAIPFDDVAAQWPIILNLLAGCMLGAWVGASWASRMAGRTLYQVLAMLLVLIAVVLLLGHDRATQAPLLTGPAQMVAGVVAGFGIGVVVSIMGVAGGELLIPTLILLFGVEVKLAGSLSLAVSLPTMVVGFARYSQDQAFTILRTNKSFVLAMAAGSLVGAAIGGRLLGVVPDGVLLPTLAAILVISSVKVWRHK